MRRLLIRPGAIGDCINCFPAMEWLRGGSTEVWIPRRVTPLVRFATHLRALEDTGIERPAMREQLSRLLAGFDEIVSWTGANRPDLQDELRRMNPNCRFFQALPTDAAEHAADYYLRQVGGPAGLAPQIRLPAVERRNRIAIHPFSGGRMKNWPLERFEELTRVLPLPVEWTAGPEEDLPHAHRFEDLGRLGRWLKGAQLYIGNDSGVTHLAAALEVPTVALFGTSNAAVWAPRGRHVRVVERRSMLDISAEEVTVAALELLKHC